MEGVEAGGLDSALVVTVPEAEKHLSTATQN
jgi:hypothetical protein